MSKDKQQGQEAWDLLCQRLQRDPATSEEDETCSLRAAWKAMLAFAAQFSQPSPDGDVVERVALALINERRRFGNRQLVASLDDLEDHQKRDDIRAARAAISVMGGDARSLALEEAAKEIIEHRSSTYTARNGRRVGIQGDDGEKVWLVHSDHMFALEQSLSTHPTPAEDQAQWDAAVDRLEATAGRIGDKIAQALPAQPTPTPEQRAAMTELQRAGQEVDAEEVTQADRAVFARLFGVLPSDSPIDRRALRDLARHRIAARKGGE